MWYESFGILGEIKVSVSWKERGFECGMIVFTGIWGGVKGEDSFG